jgi:hypothetical protein
MFFCYMGCTYSHTEHVLLHFLDFPSFCTERRNILLLHSLHETDFDCYVLLGFHRNTKQWMYIYYDWLIYFLTFSQ